MAWLKRRADEDVERMNKLFQETVSKFNLLVDAGEMDQPKLQEYLDKAFQPLYAALGEGLKSNLDDFKSSIKEHIVADVQSFRYGDWTPGGF